MAQLRDKPICAHFKNDNHVFPSAGALQPRNAESRRRNGIDSIALGDLEIIANKIIARSTKRKKNPLQTVSRSMGIKSKELPFQQAVGYI